MSTARPPRRKRFEVAVAAMSAVLLTTPAAAFAQAIYRCEQGGRVTYTDSPCDRRAIQQGNKPNATGGPRPAQTVVGGGYENPYGPWRGQAQYQVKHTGRRTDGTHSVVPLIIHFAEDGKLAGSSRENGCQLLGLVSPGPTPKMLNVDATLSNCAAPDMNQRYHGTFTINSKDRTGRLALRAQRVGIGTAMFADVQAVLRR